MFFQQNRTSLILNIDLIIAITHPKKQTTSFVSNFHSVVSYNGFFGNRFEKPSGRENT